MAKNCPLCGGFVSTPDENGAIGALFDGGELESVCKNCNVRFYYDETDDDGTIIDWTAEPEGN